MENEISEEENIEDPEEIDEDNEDECECDNCMNGSCNYHDDSYCGESVKHLYERFVFDIESKGFKYVACGSFRSAYIRNNLVIKVPNNEDGIIDNKIEARAWRKYKNKPANKGIMLAPCRLLPNGCLIMKKVNTKIPSLVYNEMARLDSPIRWAYDIDGNQVGMYRDKLVAYDYAMDISEREEWEDEMGLYSHCYRGNWC